MRREKKQYERRVDKRKSRTGIGDGMQLRGDGGLTGGEDERKIENR